MVNMLDLPTDIGLGNLREALREILAEAVQTTETTIPLLAGASFTGISHDCRDYAEFCVSCFASHPGTLFVENSRSGVPGTWRTHDTISIAAGTPVDRVYAVTKIFNRVRYTNGPTVQTEFELVTLRRPLG